MKIRYVFALLVVFLCVGILYAATPSPEIQKVLKERYDGKYDLNLAGLIKSDVSKEERNRLSDQSSYEVYHVPYPGGTADYFSYAIYRFKDTREIWIVKSGGIAGIFEIYVVVNPPRKSVEGGFPDPRSKLLPVILFHHQKEPRDGMHDPLLIYARWDIKPPNEILGSEDSFTDEQIIAGLRKFYREWKPTIRDEQSPQIIFAKQNWGCGMGIQNALEALSIEFEFDVYELYPVLGDLASDAARPAPNDKRLVEIIKGS